MYKMTAALWGITTFLYANIAAADQLTAATAEEQIDEIFSQWDSTNSPGCIAYAFQDGEIIFQKGYGMADLEWGRPIEDDTVFYIASTSKQFAAASIALLVLDGDLAMDDDVRQFIPELPDVGHTITVANLVFHTSGLRDYLGLKGMMGDNSGLVSNAQVVEMMSKQQDLNFVPGAEWSYSNSGYVMMSVLVERVSGMTLAEFSRQRIFEPLGMVHSQFDDNHRSIIRNRARSYSKDPEAGWLRHPKLIDATGDGNLQTTIGDLLRWDENFYDPNPEVGRGQAFVDLIQTPGAQTTVDDLQYAFGLMVGNSYRSLAIVSHGGGFYGFRTQLMRFPEQHFSSGALCNAGDANPDDLSYKIADIFLADVLGPTMEDAGEDAKEDGEDATAGTEVATYQVAKAALRGLAGTYRSPEIGIEAVLSLNGGNLHISTIRDIDGDLNPLAADQFQLTFEFMPGVTMPIDVRVERDSNGQVDHLRLDVLSVKNFRMDKID